MKKITKITIAILFWIFAPLLIILLPEIKTSVKDIVLNSKDVSDIIGLYFGSIPIVASAVIVWMSVEEMKKQNKISADSVKEMKKQHIQNEENSQLREEKKELREFIDKHLISEIEKIRPYKKNLADRMPDDKSDEFNFYSYKSFIKLLTNSQGLFYKNNLELIMNKIFIYYDITCNFEGYSSDVKLRTSMLFTTISEDLYSALNSEIALKNLINQIDDYRNDLEKILTPKEIEKLKNKLEEYQKESDEALLKHKKN